MLRADSLTRRYGDVVAVDDVSFETTRGEIVGLLGHNGAGKTTVMKLLTGFLEPSAGAAYIDDIDVLEQPEVARANIGYLPENRPLYSELTVVDYLAFTATVRGIDASERQAAVVDAIEKTDLRDRIDDEIGTLSRGYQQRVGVAQAMVHHPKALILDEPTNGLDPSQTQQMRELIRALSEESTVLLSTHIMQEVEAICDRVLIMRNGRIVVDEKLSELKEGRRCWLQTDASLAEVKGALGNQESVYSIDGRFLISRADDVAVEIASVVRELVGAGIAVHAIEPERRDLEALFRAVSEGSNEL